MRAEITGCGLLVTLINKDKALGEQTGLLECRLHGWKQPNLVLNIVDEVTGTKGIENPGFHIDVTPPHVSPQHREKYEIYLSKEHFHALTNPTGSKFKGGYYISRSLYDRVEFVYFDV